MKTTKNKKYHFIMVNGKKVFKGQNSLKHINKITNWGFLTSPKFKKGRLYYLVEEDGYTFVRALKSTKQRVIDFLLRNGMEVPKEIKWDDDNCLIMEDEEEEV